MTMFRLAARSLLGALSLALALAFTAAPAHAQATRTWVSGVGDDVNPCSRTAPCKTFAGAISKTATGGEINCLDPAGFGSVTITKSLTILCDFTGGGILNASTSGVIVNTPATSSVTLSGLDFNGADSGTNGVRIISGGTVTIQNCLIANNGATSGLGISVAPSGALQLSVRNTTISDNGNGNTGGGIRVQPTGAAGTAKIVLQDVRLVNNANVGFAVDTTGSTSSSGVFVTMKNVSITGVVTGAGAAVDAFQPAGGQGITIIVTDSLLANNSAIALRANGAGTRIQLAGSTIANSGTAATQVGGAVVNTFGDNVITGNASNGTFTQPPVPKG